MIRDEKRLLPLIQPLLRNRVWQYSDLPAELKAVRPLGLLKGWRWIEFRFYVPGFMVDWTIDADLEDWVLAADADLANLEIRVSREAVRRLDELSLLTDEHRARFSDLLAPPRENGASLNPAAGLRDRRILNPSDRRVLDALARLARGIVIETPRVDSGNGEWEADGQERLVDWVPELFLQLELLGSSLLGHLAGSLVALERRQLIERERRRFRISSENSRYRTGNGVVWFLGTGVPFIAYPSRINIPTLGLRSEDGSRLRDGLAWMKWYRLTPTGWEIAEYPDSEDSLARKAATTGDSGGRDAVSVEPDFGVPALPQDPNKSDMWVTQVAAAKSMGYENHKHLKNVRRGGEFGANGNVGRDAQGRMWRRDKEDSRLLWYYKPSLIKKNSLGRRRKSR